MSFLLLGSSCFNTSITSTTSTTTTLQTNSKPTQGPYVHEIHSASSEDGLIWKTDSNKPLVEHASVPVAITQTNNTIMVYYVDALQGPDTFGCIKSVDGGETFSKETCVINGSAIDRAVDFTVVQLENNQYRLYYFGSKGFSGDPASGTGDHTIYSAISDDGITFTEEGEVFTYQGLVDPDVFWNGETWVMHVFSLTDKKTVVATSTTGTNFTFYEFLDPVNYGVNKPVTLKDNTFRMYGFEQGTQNTFYSFTSSDGFVWTLEEGTRLTAPSGFEITDPSVVQIADGSYKMFYKTSPKVERVKN